MDFSINSVEIIPDLKASAAFTVNSREVFKEEEDITPVVIDKNLSYMPNPSQFHIQQFFIAAGDHSTFNIQNSTFKNSSDLHRRNC